MSPILIDYEESAHNKVQTFEDNSTDDHRVLLSGSIFFFPQNEVCHVSDSDCSRPCRVRRENNLLTKCGTRHHFTVIFPIKKPS